MKKTVSYSKSQLLDDLGRLALMVLASVIMAVNLKSFVQAGDLVPGGFNGLTLLIQRVALRFWGLSVPFSAINFLLNAVPAAISFKFVGKKFTLYSCQCIVLVSIFTDLVPTIPITEDLLLICVFGGLITVSRSASACGPEPPAEALILSPSPCPSGRISMPGTISWRETW